jgi:hypothetical protein
MIGEQDRPSVPARGRECPDVPPVWDAAALRHRIEPRARIADRGGSGTFTGCSRPCLLLVAFGRDDASMCQTGDWIEYEGARVRVVHAIETRPEDGFTARSLAAILGFPTFEVRRALDELTADGILACIDGEYVSALRPTGSLEDGSC